MSKIENLINKLCPDGVSFFKIEELCDITRGKVMSKDFIRNNVGDYPVYSSQTENNGELGKISTYEFDGEYLTWTTDGANAGSVFYRNGKFSVTNVCGLLKVKNNIISTKFLYYILTIEAPKYVNAGMGNPKLMSNVMARIKVAVPPMEVQNEIVHIFDDFTLLSAELSAELKARQKQYEYYKRKLFEIDGQQLKLKDIADIYDSLHATPKYVDEGYSMIRVADVKFGIVNTKETLKVNEETYKKFISKYKPQKDDIIISRVGTYGNLCIVGDEPVCLGQNTSIINPKINKKYL